MQFSDTTDNQGILQDVHFLCGTDSTSYSTNDIVRNVNRWVYRAVVWSIEANQDWQFDDVNHTTHPIAKADLVDTQQDYQLPSDILKLHAVSVMDSAGNYQRVVHIDEKDIPVDLDEFAETDGMPQYYDVVGGSLFLYPAPAAASVTTSNGLKLSVSREIDVFAGTDTTQEVALPEPFARIASYGAAYDYLMVEGPLERASTIRAEIEAMRRDLQSFVASRNTQATSRIRPSTLSSRNNTIV